MSSFSRNEVALSRTQDRQNVQPDKEDGLVSEGMGVGGTHPHSRGHSGRGGRISGLQWGPVCLSSRRLACCSSSAALCCPLLFQLQCNPLGSLSTILKMFFLFRIGFHYVVQAGPAKFWSSCLSLPKLLEVQVYVPLYNFKLHLWWFLPFDENESKIQQDRTGSVSLVHHDFRA